MNRESCLALTCSDPSRFDLSPLQLGMRRDAWRVTIASMLLHRCRRTVVDRVLPAVLEAYGDASAMSNADQATLAAMLSPCGLQHRRAKMLRQFSVEWLGEWDSITELHGVGRYTADAVRLFCFGNANVTCGDGALEAYANRIKQPAT